MENYINFITSVVTTDWHFKNNFTKRNRYSLNKKSISTNLNHYDS